MAPATQYLLGVLMLIVLVTHLLSHVGEPMQLLLRTVLRLIESFALTVSVMLLTHGRVESDADLLTVELGWPLNFIVQDQSRYDPPFPWDTGWAWESPTHFDLLNLAINWLVFLLLVYLVHLLILKFWWRKLKIE